MLQKDKLIEMYRKMLEIRYFEEELFYLFLQGTMSGTMHQYTGEEAIAVGICANLRKNDYVLSSHRGHGHCIAKGASLDRIMAELFGKTTGLCKGFGGSMHLVDINVGFLGANGIVGASIPIAAGVGLSNKYRKTDQVVACFFGDGASNTGAFHEGINLAAIWRLPVIFVCENNLYAVSTHVSKVMLVKDIASRSSAYGIPGIVVDGNDVIAVYEAAHEAVDRARAGRGPTLIECKTYRHRGHSRFESSKYRSKEEIEEWLKKDPIPRFKEKLIEMNVLTKDEADDIEKEVTSAIKDAVKFAETSPLPSPGDVLKYVYV
jgi:pyruvate dehydrogenase E1 component alpha subunit